MSLEFTTSETHDVPNPKDDKNNTNTRNTSNNDSAAAAADIDNRPVNGEWDWALTNYDVENTEPQSISNELRRLQVLKSYLILDSEREVEFDRLTQMGSRIFKAPICLISLVDLGRQWLLSTTGVGDVRETPRNVAFCAHAILNKKSVFVIPDTLKDFRFQKNPLVTGAPHIRFYAGSPLISPEGYKLGTFCVIDTDPRPHGLTQDESDNLIDLAALTVKTMTDRRLLSNREDPARMIACTAHDLLTPLCGVQLSLSLLKEDQEVQQNLNDHNRELVHTAARSADIMLRICQGAIETLRETNKSTIKVSDQIGMIGAGKVGVSSADHSPCVDMEELFKSLHLIMDPIPKRVPCILSCDKSVPAKILTDDLKIFRSSLNLLSNACAVTHIGSVHFRIYRKEDQLVFECEDTGNDIPEHDYGCLFAPCEDGAGRRSDLGLYSVASQIDALGGSYGYRPRNADEDGNPQYDSKGRRKHGSIFWFQIPIVLPDDIGSLDGEDGNENAGDNCAGSVGGEDSSVRRTASASDVVLTPGMRIPSSSSFSGFHNTQRNNSSILAIAAAAAEGMSEKYKNCHNCQNFQYAETIGNKKNNNKRPSIKISDQVLDLKVAASSSSNSSTAAEKIAAMANHMDRKNNADGSSNNVMIPNEILDLNALAASSPPAANIPRSASDGNILNDAGKAKPLFDLNMAAPTSSKPKPLFDLSAMTSSKPKPLFDMTAPAAIDTKQKPLFEIKPSTNNNIFKNAPPQSSSSTTATTTSSSSSKRTPTSSSVLGDKTSEKRSRKKKALIIEDSAVVSKCLARALTLLGYEDVKQAENGAIGLQNLQQDMYDLCLCDFLMPVMDGLDCVQQFRDWEKDNRPSFRQYIVGISAHASKNDIEKGLKIGMDDYRPKPVTIKVLKSLLASPEIEQICGVLDELYNVNKLKEKIRASQQQSYDDTTTLGLGGKKRIRRRKDGSIDVDDNETKNMSTSNLSVGESASKSTDDSMDNEDSSASEGSKTFTEEKNNSMNSKRPRKRSKLGEEGALSESMGNKDKVCLIATDRSKESIVLIKQIEKLGWKAKTAPDGENALKLLKLRNWGAVLLDDDLPVLSGIQCTSKFREWESKNRVNRQNNIFLVCTYGIDIPSSSKTNSTFDKSDNNRNTINCSGSSIVEVPSGFDGVLHNPVSLDHFKIMISKTKSLKRLHDEGLAIVTR